MKRTLAAAAAATVVSLWSSAPASATSEIVRDPAGDATATPESLVRRSAELFDTRFQYRGGHRLEVQARLGSLGPARDKDRYRVELRVSYRNPKGKPGSATVCSAAGGPCSRFQIWRSPLRFRAPVRGHGPVTRIRLRLRVVDVATAAVLAEDDLRLARIGH